MTSKKIPQKHTMKKSPNIDMPHYCQYGGACGLTSLLMALKPESRGFEEVLESIAAKHDDLIDTSVDKGHRWQQALEYMLFQIPKNPQLQTILKKEYKTDFTDGMLPLLEFSIEEGRRENEELNHDWLMNRVNTWKKDVELQMLGALFGCKFTPYINGPEETGAINLSDIETKDRKLAFMIPTVNLKQDPLLCCSSVHWIAIKEIDPKMNQFKYHDPAGGSEGMRSLNHLSSSERFYAFHCSPQKFTKNKSALLDI